MRFKQYIAIDFHRLLKEKSLIADMPGINFEIPHFTPNPLRLVYGKALLSDARISGLIRTASKGGMPQKERGYIMHSVKLDLKHGVIFIDSIPIKTDKKNSFSGSISCLCFPPIRTDDGQTQYRFLRKLCVCGQTADCVIEVREDRLCAITFQFDLIEFFESGILESTVLKAFEKSFKLIFKSDHPSTAFFDLCEWGHAVFFYDAKQGDLSLDITFQHSTKHPTAIPEI